MNREPISAADHQKAWIVSNFYSLTDGAIERCLRIAPRESPQVRAYVSRFWDRYPELKSLIRKSPFLEYARRENRESLEILAAMIRGYPYAETCSDVTGMLRSILEDPEESDEWVAKEIEKLKK